MVARRRFLLLAGGENHYHMVHVNDLVRGLRLLGSHPVDFYTKSRAFSIEDGIGGTLDRYVTNGYIEAAYQR